VRQERGHDQRSGRVEAGIDALEVTEGREHQARADEQDHRQRDFGDDEHAKGALPRA
jgi:hypothetical protein